MASVFAVVARAIHLRYALLATSLMGCAAMAAPDSAPDSAGDTSPASPSALGGPGMPNAPGTAVTYDCACPVLYGAFGVGDGFDIMGRVVSDSPTSAPHPADGAARNLGATARALATDEVPGATVVVGVAGRSFSVTADDEGVFELHARGVAPPLASGQHALTLTVTQPACKSAKSAPRQEAAMLHILPPTPSVALISDFDDTVCESKVTDLSYLLWQTATRNALQLQPVPGAAEAYAKAMHAGAALVLYVSGSPLGLFDRLVTFLHDKGLPGGPLLLKDIGHYSLANSIAFKTERIEAILTALPHTRFVLVGDSGEGDPEIYRALALSYPQRIAAIAIRKVAGSDVSSERLCGMSVFDDYARAPNVLGQLVGSARTIAAPASPGLAACGSSPAK